MSCCPLHDDLKGPAFVFVLPELSGVVSRGSMLCHEESGQLHSDTVADLSAKEPMFSSKCHVSCNIGRFNT